MKMSQNLRDFLFFIQLEIAESCMKNNELFLCHFPFLRSKEIKKNSHEKEKLAII